MIGKNTKVVLVAPAVIYLAALLLFPGLFNLYAAFYRWPLGLSPHFIGFYNFYRALLLDDRLHHAFAFTALYSAVSVSVEILLGLGLALLLYSMPLNPKVSYTIRLLLVIPFMVAPITAGYMWRMLFHGSYGPLTYLMSLIGLGRVDIYSHPKLAFWGVVIIDVWQWTPFTFLVFYSGLNSLPSEPFEAALVDGARGWNLFKYVTFPLLEPLVLVVALLRVIDAFKVFDTIYISTGGGPGICTESISLYIYEKGLHGGFELGYSGCIAWLFFLVMFFITTVFLIAFRRVIRI